MLTLFASLALAAAEPADVTANRAYACAARGFQVRLRFAADGRHFTYENSVGETGEGVVTWDTRGEGRTADPGDPRLSVNEATGQFSMRGQTCVIDDERPAREHE